MAANELGNYLRTLRGTVSPEQVGLAGTPRRRVPGLRRAELSRLVGLSTEYYIRLEQGRAVHPSDKVLLAISRALQLGAAERAHLLDLAHHPRPIRPSAPDALRGGLDNVVHGITTYPALVLNRAMDVLAWNELASAVFVDFAALPTAERNMARFVFLHPEARDLQGDWAAAAKDTVGILRLAMRREPVEESLVLLVNELRARSRDFAELWETHFVHEKTHGERVLFHPVVGELRIQYETFLVSGQEHHMLVVYTADPSTVTYTRLQALRTISRAAAAEELTESAPPAVYAPV